MKNRAKCKLCNSIIESFHPTDHVICKCGEIELNGGDGMYAKANDFKNFVRVDDRGNEIVVRYHQVQPEVNADEQPEEEPKDLGFSEAVQELQRLVDLDEQFLKQGNNAPVSRYDLSIYMLYIVKIFKSIRNE